MIIKMKKADLNRMVEEVVAERVAKKKMIKEAEGGSNHYIVSAQSAKGATMKIIVAAGSASQAKMIIASSVKAGASSVGKAYKMSPASVQKLAVIVSAATKETEEPNQTFTPKGYGPGGKYGGVGQPLGKNDE